MWVHITSASVCNVNLKKRDFNRDYFRQFLPFTKFIFSIIIRVTCVFKDPTDLMEEKGRAGRINEQRIAALLSLCVISYCRDAKEFPNGDFFIEIAYLSSS